MYLQPSSQTSFKGYDARPLKGFLMNSNYRGIAQEMNSIGKKEGFNVFSATRGCYKGFPQCTNGAGYMWTQDYWTVVKNSIISYKFDEQFEAIKKHFKLIKNPVQERIRSSCEFIGNETQLYINNLNKKTHIPGGNVFIVKGDSKDELIIGEEELKKFGLDEIKQMFSVEKVCVLPQMDYHLDLFIRPLDNKRVLLADDKETLKFFRRFLDKLKLEEMKLESTENSSKNVGKNANSKIVLLQNKFLNFKQSIKLNPHPNADEIAKILKENGYEVIRVPGRIYKTVELYDGQVILSHQSNFINANVLKNKNGDIVYITNKSKSDALEKAFIESISPYVKKEHIYFVEGDMDFVSSEMLPGLMGGIHCACAEIPRSI